MESGIPARAVQWRRAHMHNIGSQWFLTYQMIVLHLLLIRWSCCYWRLNSNSWRWRSGALPALRRLKASLERMTHGSSLRSQFRARVYLGLDKIERRRQILTTFDEGMLLRPLTLRGRRRFPSSPWSAATFLAHVVRSIIGRFIMGDWLDVIPHHS